MGKFITEKQKGEEWGNRQLNDSQDLQGEFAGVSGYSANNLWIMRSFYRVYQDSPNLAPLVQKIPWSHNLLIVQKVKKL